MSPRLLLLLVEVLLLLLPHLLSPRLLSCRPAQVLESVVVCVP